jgi:hypothetical protein
MTDIEKGVRERKRGVPQGALPKAKITEPPVVYVPDIKIPEITPQP